MKYLQKYKDEISNRLFNTDYKYISLDVCKVIVLEELLNELYAEQFKTSSQFKGSGEKPDLDKALGYITIKDPSLIIPAMEEYAEQFKKENEELKMENEELNRQLNFWRIGYETIKRKH